MFLPCGRWPWFSVRVKVPPIADGAPEIQSKALLVTSFLVWVTLKLLLT